MNSSQTHPNKETQRLREKLGVVSPVEAAFLQGMGYANYIIESGEMVNSKKAIGILSSIGFAAGEVARMVDYNLIPSRARALIDQDIECLKDHDPDLYNKIAERDRELLRFLCKESQNAIIAMLLDCRYVNDSGEEVDEEGHLVDSDGHAPWMQKCWYNPTKLHKTPYTDPYLFLNDEEYQALSESERNDYVTSRYIMLVDMATCKTFFLLPTQTAEIKELLGEEVYNTCIGTKLDH